MGKNGRKQVAVAPTEMTSKNSSGDSSERHNERFESELEARLQRLEASHVHRQSSSDVYKFVFFFIMGVALTILLYPQVSSTFNSQGIKSTNQRSDIQDKYTHEQDADDLNSIKDELKNNDQVEAKVKTNRTHRSLDLTRLNSRKTSDRDIDVETEDTFISNLENRRKELEVDDKKTKLVEDLMIGEEINDDSSFIENYENDIEIETIDEENDVIKMSEEPQRVELFSMNSDEIITSESDVDNEPKSVKFFSMDAENNDDKPIKRNMDKTNTEANIKDSTKRKNDKTKNEKSKNTKAKGKSKDKNSKVKDDDKINDPNIPKEIRDFKPTYQKTLTPKKVFIDGRRIPPMELLPQKPNNSSVKIWLFEEFLSDDECDNLMRVHKLHVDQQSKDPPILCFDSIATLRKHLENVGKKHVQVSPLDFTQGTTCVNSSFSGKLKMWLKGNWSYSTAFYPGESNFASIFEQRVKQAMGLLPENGGKFQITSYPPGIGYKSHTDCTEDSDKRDRMATVLVYLDTVDEGGETDFPELGIWARPRKGRALLWNNMDPDGNCEPMSIHKANKVVKGHKYILQRWYYYKSFYSLGKRPPEPPLPKRKPGQPRVSCDEFEHGSCRWYDEWNFEHVIEYERQKYTLV